MAAPVEGKRVNNKPSKTSQIMALDPNQQKEVTKKLKGKITQGGTLKSGVVYVGNIPHGFFEWDMKRFFSQFGRVKQLRLSRSKKTGRSKGYAFIEFECDAVAKVVAETMNNYLMFEKLLKCQLLPPDKVHPAMFRGSDRKFSKPKAHTVAIQRHNNQNPDNTLRRFSRKNKAREEKLKALGIDMDFSSVIHAKPETKDRKRKSSKQSEPESSGSDTKQRPSKAGGLSQQDESEDVTVKSVKRRKTSKSDNISKKRKDPDTVLKAKGKTLTQRKKTLRKGKLASKLK